MEFSYSSELLNKHITPKTCKDVLQYSVEEVIALTGIYGIEKSFKNITVVQFEGYYPALTISITLDKIGLELIRRIRFDERYIYNDKFKVREEFRQQGHALRMLENQIDVATSSGFDDLRCWAYGGAHVDPKIFCGHIIWAKLGFTPFDRSIEEFADWLKLNKRTETTMQQLMSTDNGRELWNDFGTDLLVIFNLSKKSKNRIALKAYKDTKI